MGSASGIHVRVLVQGELGPTWSAMFSGLDLEPVSVGTTLIYGQVPDQAALHGLFAAIRDLGLSLTSIVAGDFPDASFQELSERRRAITR